MKKIQIYVEEIKYCEVDKQVILLANSLSDFFDITIISIGKIKNEIALNKKVKLVEFNMQNLNGYFNQRKLKNSIIKYIKSNECNTIISISFLINKILSNIITNSEMIYWKLDDSLISDSEVSKCLKNFKKIIFDNEEEKNHYKFLEIDKYVISPAIVSVSMDFERKIGKNLLYIGSLDDDKVFKDIIGIMDKVLHSVEDAKLYILGNNKKRLERISYCKDLKLHNNIIFYGDIESNELDYELKRMDLFINFENNMMANVRLIEVMNYGIPPISYYNETLKNIIDNDINGYLIDEHDIDRFSEKIILLLTNEESMDNMGMCARETSMYYEINSIKSEWLKIL